MSHTDKHTLGGTAHHDPDTLANLNALISGLTGALRDIGIGPLSSRPAAGTADRLWFATDQLALYRDTGTVWEASRSWQQSVRSFAISTPASPELGERHLIEPGASGEFGAHANQIATCLTTAPDPVTWSYVSPESGWVVTVADDYGQNSIYEYFEWNDGLLGPPPPFIRPDGWVLRSNQNVGISGSPTFQEVNINPKPTFFPYKVVRREELWQYTWQGSVIAAAGTPPVSPAYGDRYLVTNPDPGDWENFDNEIVVLQPPIAQQAEMWLNYAPQPGWTVYDVTNNKFYSWNGSVWKIMGDATTPFWKSMLGLTQKAPDFQYAARLDQMFESLFGHIVVDTTINNAPLAPAAFSRYVVAAGSTPGDPWEGQAGKIAIAIPAYSPVQTDLGSVSSSLDHWEFVTPSTGMVVYDQTYDLYFEYNGAAWVSHLPESHASSHVTGGTDVIPSASAVSSGLVSTIAQSIAGDKTFLNNVLLALLNSGDEIITTNTSGQLQESGVKVTVAPGGGSGFTFVEYAVAPVNPPAGFAWFQAKDANTKTFNYYNGVSTFSVDLSV